MNMIAKVSFTFVLLLASLTFVEAQGRVPKAAPPPAPAPPAIYPAPAAVPPSSAPVYVYDQRPVAGRQFLVAPEQAQSIIDRFKQTYQEMGSPRFLIYVNRELVDERSGMKLSSQRQVIESTRTLDPSRPADAGAQSAAAAGEQTRQTERVSSTNIYRFRDRKEAPLEDRQTMRDVERLFGRPLRMANVQLADQRLASQLIGGKPVDAFALHTDGEQARKEREALTRIADVALEILVSSRQVTVPEVAGDRIYTVPDIQATAIRLSDARILGQATAADLIGHGTHAGSAARTFGVREIAEATALSLMEDIMLK
jgi:hypothetical protein